MAEWQDIKTAPFNRERVLVYEPRYGILMAYFVTGYGWQVYGANNHPWFVPTHWQSLPEPPK